MYVVVAARAVPEHLHGYLSRFLSEVGIGIYVGVISPVVADRLWERCLTAQTSGSVTMVLSDAHCEQGFTVRTAGDPQRHMMDSDGLCLAYTTPLAPSNHIME